VVLPDGTKVWLNAASSLRYPTAFSGKKRQIAITGEAYFEVAKDKAKPFFIKINNEAVIEVLGTNFNVNAYEDEASINTTLLEGSIRVEALGTLRGRPAGRNAVILQPGQQGQIAAGQKTGQRQIKVIKDADIEKVMAWKNGAFNFNNASLEEVMRQLERWYDIQVVYENGIPDIHFGGELSRGVSLADLIKALKDSEIHFRIEEGRRLVVLP
jgi:ferric-dicitrate binding protein FerR (iron transport regulator)